MRPLTDFTTLTFDCYGTLIDWESGILAELRPWADRHHVPAANDTLLETFGTTEAAVEAERPGDPYPRILEEVLRRLSTYWQVTSSDAEVAEFGQSVGRWPAFADSPDALAYLTQHYKLVILSNVDRESFAKSNARLGVTFDRILTAQDIGSYKPDLRNFRYAIDDVQRTLGTAPHQILHTAQSIFHDVVPAKSLGLATMWINRRKALGGGWGATPAPSAAGDATRPDYEVGSMGEFAARHREIISARG